MSQDFMLFQQNLRKTALGVRFGKTLLTEPDSISPQTITNVIKAMGLKIPDEVQLTADMAQVLVTGQAAIDAYQAAETVTDYREAIQLSANSSKLFIAVGKKMDWFDQDTGSILALGTDVACIIGSGGADVGAWVRVAMNIGMESMSAQAEAEMMAKKSVIGAYQGAIKAESQNFIRTLTRLDQGEIGIFGFLVENAQGSKILFDQLITKNPSLKPLVDKIPGLHLLPMGSWTFNANATARTWWGEGKNASESITVPALVPLRGQQVVDYLLDYLVGIAANWYLGARRYYMENHKADLFNVAVLSLFEPDFTLMKSMDTLNTMVKYQISPYELGEPDAMVSIGAENTTIQTNFGVTVKEGIFTDNEIRAMDRAGNISALKNDRNVNYQLRKRFDFPETPQERAYGFNAFPWRKMANFIAILDFLDMVYSDPNYEAYRSKSATLANYDIFPKIGEFKERFEMVYKRSVIRRINVASRVNAAYFLGVPVSSLVEQKRPGQATIFRGV